MAETHEGLQQTREEVKTDQIITFLQSFGVVLTENRDILSALPELIKKLEANITKATGTATNHGTREISGLTEEQESRKKKWETQQKRQEKQISRLENELQEANKTILDLEARNKQNDNDVEMLKRENRDLSDKNYYKSKYRDFKAKLKTTNEDLKAKTEKIAALGRELTSKQEDYDAEMHRTRRELTKKEKETAELREVLRAKQEDYEKETQHSRKELAEKEKELAKVMEQLHTIKQQHDESFRGQETKIDELQARVSQLEGERLSLQEEFEKEKQRREEELNEKDNALHKGKIERERAKQHYTDNLRDVENKLKRSEAWNENLRTEIAKKKQELRHYVERFAGICEKRVKQDQRKVENILASNQQSEVEKDFKEFFDSSREDARDIIQSLYGSEEEIDVHVYYPRIACTILETAYEHTNDVKEAVIDLFKVATKNMVLHAPKEGYNFRLKRTEGSFDYYPSPIDELNTSDISTDVLDALLISLKETAHICSLECLEKDVMESSWKKWTEWFEKDKSFVHAPTQEVLLKLDCYIKACIRLTWRMVTQLPPLQLEYHSPWFDRHIHKKTAYQNTTEKNPGNEESLGEEILCYLWPGLLDGGERLILQGQVLCKIQREKLK